MDLDQPLGKVTVVIVRTETKFCDNNIENLTKAFSDDLFSLAVYEPSANNENLYMKEIFDKYRSPLIAIKDSSICQIAGKNLSRVIRQAILQARKNHLDIIYLCSWGDRCDRQKDLGSLGEGLRLKITEGNSADQAIFYNEKSIKLLKRSLKHSSFKESLIRLINDKELKAALFSPNLVHFDNHLAPSKQDYLRSNMCAISMPEDNKMYIYIWLIVLAILLLLVIWLVL